jgi:protein SCO1
MNRLLAIAALFLAGTVAAMAQNRWGEGYLPNVPVVTHHGETLRFYDDLMKDRIVVISFIYTSCRDICPMVTARLAQLEDKLGEAMGRDVFFISISVDPETDTPEKLKDYAEAFQAGPGWVFITGKPADIGAIRHKLGDRGAKISDHRNEVLLANATRGDWERSSVFSDINALALSVRAMDPVSHAELGKDAVPQPKPGRVAAPSHKNLPGQALFARTCASCHTVGRGDRVGPDLGGLMTRRSRDWVSRYVIDPDKLRREGDPAALALAERFKTIRMPRLGLAEGDVQDLIAYVEAQTFNVSAGKPAAGHHHH